MAGAKKTYSRYFIVRGLQTMWRGEPAELGSLFREFVITSNEFAPSTLGTFQVYGLQAESGGIKDNNLVPSGKEPTLLFDRDFNGLDSTVKQFQQLVAEAEKNGFRAVTIMDELEFEEKLRRSRRGL